MGIIIQQRMKIKEVKNRNKTRNQKVRDYLKRNKERFFTADEIAEASGENPAKVKEALRYLVGREAISIKRNGETDVFGYKETGESTKTKLAPRVRDFIENHPKEVFTADEVTKALKENRAKVIQSLSDLARLGDIGRFGRGRDSLFGTKETIKQVELMPETLEEARNMNTSDFQDWICDMLDAERSPTKSRDNGIDGWLADGSPIQVKRSDGVGRDKLDQFESAIRRDRKNSGMFIALSFTKGAKDEVIRAKEEDRLDIELKEVKDFF